MCIKQLLTVCTVRYTSTIFISSPQPILKVTRSTSLLFLCEARTLLLPPLWKVLPLEALFNRARLTWCPLEPSLITLVLLKPLTKGQTVPGLWAWLCVCVSRQHAFLLWSQRGGWGRWHHKCRSLMLNLNTQLWFGLFCSESEAGVSLRVVCENIHVFLANPESSVVLMVCYATTSIFRVST